MTEYEFLQMIDNKQYDEIIRILQREDYISNRMFRVVFKMLKGMKNIEKSKFYNANIVEYKTPKTKCINRFYEALRYKDFIEANSMAAESISFLKKRGEDYKEMEVYKKVLEDILLVLKDKKVASSPIEQEYYKKTKELETIGLYREEYTNEDLNNMYMKVTKLIELSRELKYTYANYHYIKVMIEEIFDIQNGCGKNYSNNFASFSYTPTKNFYIDLDNKEYLTAKLRLEQAFEMEKGATIKWTHKVMYKLLCCLENEYIKNGCKKAKVVRVLNKKL